MNYKMLTLALIGILFLSYTAESAAQQFNVQFNVPAQNELSDEVKSYGAPELRALHDVRIIDTDPSLSAYHISIYPVFLKLKNGITYGVVVSYVIDKDGITEHAVLTGSLEQLKSLVAK